MHRTDNPNTQAEGSRASAIRFQGFFPKKKAIEVQRKGWAISLLLLIPSGMHREEGAHRQILVPLPTQGSL